MLQGEKNLRGRDLKDVSFIDDDAPRPNSRCLVAVQSVAC